MTEFPNSKHPALKSRTGNYGRMRRGRDPDILHHAILVAERPLPARIRLSPEGVPPHVPQHVMFGPHLPPGSTESDRLAAQPNRAAWPSAPSTDL